MDSSEKRKDGTRLVIQFSYRYNDYATPTPITLNYCSSKKIVNYRGHMISTGTSMKIHCKQMVGSQTQNIMTHLPTNHTKYNHEAYLDEAGCDAGAGGDHGLETAVVHHEVTHCNIQKSVRDAACLGTHRLSFIQAVLVVIYMGMKIGFLEGRPQLTNVAKQTPRQSTMLLYNSVSYGTVCLKHS